MLRLRAFKETVGQQQYAILQDLNLEQEREEGEEREEQEEWEEREKQEWRSHGAFWPGYLRGNIYMTSAIFLSFWTPSPCPVQKSADFVPIVCFGGTPPSPTHVHTLYKYDSW